VKIEWFRSATVAIQTNSGTTILCDPWITDGAFIGSWFHFPRLEGFEFQELVARKWNFLYISHLHADHFDRKLVSAIAKAQPDCKVLLPKFEKKWLYRAVKNCGFSESRIIEIESNKKEKFSDLDITIFTADHCDPQICGASVPCLSMSPLDRSIDSLALFEADGQRVLNANDALAVESAHRLWPKIGRVDLLLGHYGGAGPYPQCFDVSEDTKSQESKKMATKFLSRLANASNFLGATFVMPYAGQYVLGGSLYELNSYRSVVSLSESLKYLNSHSKSTPISMMPFTTFDLCTGTGQREWVEPNPDSVTAYVKSISQEKYPYQLKDEEWLDGEHYLEAALTNVKKRYEDVIRRGESQTEHSISIATDTFSQTINFSKNASWLSGTNQAAFSSHTNISVDSRLLKRLILRRSGYSGFTQYHFNQAEIGSHLGWSRLGNYDPVVSYLNYMHTAI